MSLVRGPLIALILLITAGCGSLSPPPKDTFYRLDFGLPGPQGESAEAKDVIYLPPFWASGLHSERALVFAHADGTSLEQQVYHFWIDSPRVMLQHALADHLRSVVGARVVLEPATTAAYTLRGRIRRFERTNSGGSNYAQVDLNIALYGSNGSVPEFERDYKSSIPVGGHSVAAGVAALSEGTKQIFTTFTGDLRRYLEQ
ncbi:MAG: ABC-type transport auxiliary lipoprotein family protein [Proteobacteria bacterium]|nr:ABC-type transport auxiliary lipoprotein family protein [Pseudomonadota bacterium]MCZ6895093.1 ABC-type transport auxiliary lipoprotein family protein [Gammaproteobacteria bacterium]